MKSIHLYDPRMKRRVPLELKVINFSNWRVSKMSEEEILYQDNKVRIIKFYKIFYINVRCHQVKYMFTDLGTRNFSGSGTTTKNSYHKILLKDIRQREIVLENEIQQQLLQQVKKLQY